MANTVKRAFLIWMSIILFGNSITLLSGLGTIVVIAGVVIYNKVKQYDIHRQLTNVSNVYLCIHVCKLLLNLCVIIILFLHSIFNSLLNCIKLHLF